MLTALDVLLNEVEEFCCGAARRAAPPQFFAEFAGESKGNLLGVSVQSARQVKFPSPRLPLFPLGGTPGPIVRGNPFRVGLADAGIRFALMPGKGGGKMNKRDFQPLVAIALAIGLAGCASMTGKSAGTSIDDAAITASVKTKLVSDRFSTLTSVDVDTVQGTVYLIGTVPDEAAKNRAGELAREVSGVTDVVNQLKTSSRVAGDSPSHRHAEHPSHNHEDQ
jgi:hypothetical protein